MTTTKQAGAYWNRYHRTDVTSTKVIILAHGIRIAKGKHSNGFTTPVNTRLHHYIDDHYSFSMHQNTLREAIQGQYKARYDIGPGTLVDDYYLTKILGKHAPHANAHDHHSIITRVDASGSVVGKPALNAHDLGSGVHCDVLSIRESSWSGPKPRLGMVMAILNARGYSDVHCLFCRADSAASPLQAPQSRP